MSKKEYNLMELAIKELRSDDNDPLFDKTNMLYKEFPSDFRQIRYFTLLIVQSAPVEIKEINLLEQQISEVIKNAVKHGNNCDVNKKVHVWYSFSATHAHIIVEDEGEGFKDLEKWNEFNKKRLECLHTSDFEELTNYVSFRTMKSDEQDGGNALFAALEYWNGGFVYNGKRNGVAMLKRFQQKRHGVTVED
jgi:anti-sigma regulatory factor (Ser/Thr protein kinase)